MSKKKDLTGMRFERLVAIDSFLKNQKLHWNCICDCGKKLVVVGTHLSNGHYKSCGCYAREINTTHNMSRTPVYSVWRGVITRTTCPNDKRYETYGAKGITVCDKWKTFEGFWEDMKEGYKKGLTLDRIDGTKGYYKENCRWATYKEQAGNMKNNVWYEYNGMRMISSDWARYMGTHPSNLSGYMRNKKNTIESAIKYYKKEGK